jgi:predicted NAD-dependent protein-ADP-ribosyltransferase YbiA (DUF1768 family)
MNKKDIINDPTKWKGLNLLGEALMKVRSLLQKKEKEI